MDLQQAASVLGADHVAWLLKRPIIFVKHRYAQAIAAEHYYSASAINAVIERMEVPTMTNNPNAPTPPKRAPRESPLTYESTYSMNFLELLLEKVLTGQLLDHDEQTIWDLTSDIAIAQHERAGK